MAVGSNFNFKERVFIVISYIPKATVQAAIGAAPLAAMKLAGMNTLTRADNIDHGRIEHPANRSNWRMGNHVYRQ